MFINFRGEEIELKFDSLFIRRIDKSLGLKIEGSEMGKGLTFLVSGLQTADENVIAETLINSTPNNKKGIRTFDEALEIIDEIIVKGEEEDNYEALDEFCEELLEELGKLPTIRRRIRKEEEAKKKRELEN